MPNLNLCRSVPKTPALFKYMRAVALREPHNHERLVEVGGGTAALRQRRTLIKPPAGACPIHCTVLTCVHAAALCPPSSPQLCSRITSDPDRSPRALSMKSEAYARKKDLLRQLQRQR